MIVGVYGGLAGLAVALGPIVGGIIAQAIDWHWIFWINVPIGLATVLLGTRLLPDSHGAPERLDLVGVSLITAGVVALVPALTRANQLGWASAEITACLASGSLLIAASVRWEHRTAQPPYHRPCSQAASSRSATSPPISSTARRSPPRSSSPRSSSSPAATHRSAQGFDCCRSSPPRCSSPRSPAPSPTGSDAARSWCAGSHCRHSGFIWVAARGSLHTSWVELDVALLVAGIGVLDGPPTVPAAVLDAVAPHQMGKASVINFMAQRFGTVFALAIAGAVFAAHRHLSTPAAVTAGFRPAMWTCACFAALAALSAIAMAPSRRHVKSHAQPADVPIAA